MTDSAGHPALRSRWANAETLRVASNWVIILAGSWWILGQLASVMRPLLLAVFLGYVLMPYYSRLRGKVAAPVALSVLAGLTTVVLIGVAVAMYASLLGLKDDLPELKRSASTTAKLATDFVTAYLPSYAAERGPDSRPIGNQVGEFMTTAILQGVNVAAGGLLEAATAGLYLLFIMLESARFPKRVRTAYPFERAEEILDIAGAINSAIISFIRAKVFSGLILAAIVWFILGLGGVKFSFLWAMLTFLCNFIPYIGSVISYGLPTGFALLQFQFGWNFGIVAVVLLAAHVICATTLEPMLIGRAVGLSPLVVLAALSVWGLVWGLPGMFLAVPLTVVAKIVFEHIEVTRPIGRLLSGD